MQKTTKVPIKTIHCRTKYTYNSGNFSPRSLETLLGWSRCHNCESIFCLLYETMLNYSSKLQLFVDQILPCIEKFVRVDIRTVSFDVPPQEVLTMDSVTVAVDAVISYSTLLFIFFLLYLLFYFDYKTGDTDRLYITECSIQPCQLPT